MKIFCSGIGGIGLSAYAALQRASGHTVSGSDRALSALTEDLEQQGISVTDCQDGSGIDDDTDLFVYSEAIPESAPERVRAKELGVPQMSYFKALGELSKDYTVIAVCGTHGKSTTTAMATVALVEGGVDPTVVVGTKIPQLNNRNWRKGDSNIFLVEACEYRGSFLNLFPDIVLMTNVDGDHFDAYSSLEEYQDAYVEFLSRLPADGMIITHMNDSECAMVVKSAGCEYKNADDHPVIQLSVPGTHMQENAQLVCTLADHLGINADTSLQLFTGTWRRMEVKGETDAGVTVVDDYAHHPKEIRATLSAMKEAYPDRRIVCLFQPHMHDRTIRFYDDFLVAFDDADIVITTDVYDARSDVDKEHIDIQQFTNDIRAESQYAGGLDEAKNLLFCSILQQEDVLVVMGAGDVTRVAQELVA